MHRLQEYSYTISRKERKSARNNSERYCGYLMNPFKSRKTEKMARSAVDTSVQVLIYNN